MGDFKMKDIEIFNESNKEIENIEDYEKLTDYITKYMKVSDAHFNVIFVDNDKIHEINKTYRNIDRETDVISFALEDDKTFNTSEFRFLGDIYISIDKAISQAKEYNHSLKREISFLITHGFLHLLGYDHMNKDDEKIMFKLQEEILDSYGIKR
jgi:probable rRNA maturation factor